MIDDLTIADLCDDLLYAVVEILKAMTDLKRKPLSRERHKEIVEFIRRESKQGQSFYLDTLSKANIALKSAIGEDKEKLSDAIKVSNEKYSRALPTIENILNALVKKERAKPRLVQTVKTVKKRKRISASDVAKWAGVSETQVYAWDKDPPYGYYGRNGDSATIMAWCREYKNQHLGKGKPGRKPATGNAHLNSRHLRGDQTDLIADPNSTPLPARKV